MIKSSIFLVAIAMSGFASASVVNGDWNTGDGRAVFDTDTDLLWLDLNETSGYSVNQVLDQTVLGGQFEGWRLPSEGEVRTLYSNMFSSLSFSSSGVSFHQNQYALTSPMIDVFGMSYDDGSYQHAQGTYLLDGSDTETGVALFMREKFGNAQGNVAIGLAGSGADYVSENYSVYLVKNGGAEPELPTSDVSGPLGATMLLGGLALGFRRKRED